MKPMIDINNLSFSYQSREKGDVQALTGINLSVNPGEFVAILGENGSGKSTLAKLMNGILLPTEGDILIDGLNTKNQDEVWEIRQRAGMVFQNPDNQIVATVVEEDVAFGPENLSVPSKEIRERINEALSIVKMEGFMKKAPHMLSGGQKQRVAIAGILAMKPKCVILDEPTAMLDPAGKYEVMETVKKLSKEEGKTIIHITHFMEEAVNADRIIVMSKGRIVLEGKPMEVFKEVNLLKEYGLTVPEMTHLAVELKNSGINIKDDILTVEEMVVALCQLM